MRAPSTISHDSREATAMSATARLLPIIFFALVAGTAAASSIHLTFTLDPAETLPGLPVSFRVQAVNTSSSPARLPRWAVLEVTPQKGRPFLTESGTRGGVLHAAELRDGGEMLSAGETRRLDWWAGPQSPPWFTGRFWLEPGVYSLRLIADDGLEEYVSDQYDAEGLDDPITSSAAVLTIQQPEGVDAEVWQMAKAKAHWNWIHNAAEEIWTRYPESTYAGYTLPHSSEDSTLAAIERLISERTGGNRPHGAYLDWWRLQAIQIHDRKMHAAVTNDPNAAYQHAQVMRRYIDAILANDTDLGLKRDAEERKLNLPTLAQLEEYSRNLRNIYAPLQKVSPIVECVTPGLNGSFTARFGYDNLNAYVVRLLAGPANRFSPQPEDREQETHFNPGRYRNVFTVTHEGGNLVWTLHGQKVTASMRHSPRCLPPRKGSLDTESTAIRAPATPSRGVQLPDTVRGTGGSFHGVRTGEVHGCPPSASVATL
jgi:hypothetical protein